MTSCIYTSDDSKTKFRWCDEANTLEEAQYLLSQNVKVQVLYHFEKNENVDVFFYLFKGKNNISGKLIKSICLKIK